METFEKYLSDQKLQIKAEHLDELNEKLNSHKSIDEICQVQLLKLFVVEYANNKQILLKYDSIVLAHLELKNGVVDCRKIGEASYKEKLSFDFISCLIEYFTK